MNWQTLLTLSMVFVFASGCSTMRTVREPSGVNQLRIKQAKMEKKLKASDEEILALRDEVTVLQSRLEGLESLDVAAITEQYEEAENYTISQNTVSQERYTNIDVPDVHNNLIRVSASSADVQQALKNAGYYTGRIDGKFGARSKSAVFAFQKDHDLRSDGVVGKLTWSELKNYLN